MKKFLFLLLPLAAGAQEKSEKDPAFSFTVGLDISTTPVYAITKTDTAIVNALSLSPLVDLQHSSGFGVRYAPSFVASGAHPGLQYHEFIAYYQQYGEGSWNLDFSYSRFVFQKSLFYPESPINNMLYGMVGYKKSWVAPSLSAAYGFGRNTDGSKAFDASLSLGISHSFEGTNKAKTQSWSLAPSLSLNAGSNNNYSFLENVKYVSRSKKAASNIQTRKKKNSVATTSVTSSAFSVRNVELGVYSSIQWNKFEVIPMGSIFMPFSASDSFGAYWQIGLRYHF